MEDSVLNTIKKLLGLDSEYTAFDTDVVVLINAALMILQQYGIVSKEGYAITDATDKWSDFIPSDKMLQGVKEYVYLRVKMVFDPPPNSFVMEAYDRMMNELEWRLKEQMESYPGDLPREESEEETGGDD